MIDPKTNRQLTLPRPVLRNERPEEFPGIVVGMDLASLEGDKLVMHKVGGEGSAE